MAVKKKGVKNANTKTAHVLNLITTADDPTGEGQPTQVAGTQGVDPSQTMGQNPNITAHPTQTGQTSHHPIQNGAYHGSMPNSANINVAMVDDDALGLCIQGALTEHVNAELAQMQQVAPAPVQSNRPVTPAPLPPLDPSLLIPDAFDTSDLPEDLFAELPTSEAEEFPMSEETFEEASLPEHDENIGQQSNMETTYEEDEESSLPQEENMEDYVGQEANHVMEPTPPLPLSPISQAAMETQPDFNYTPSHGQTAPISPIQEAAMGGQSAPLPPLSPYTAPTFNDVPLEQVSHAPLPETLPPEPMAPPSTAPVAQLASMDHTQQYAAPNFDQVPPSQVSQMPPPPQTAPPQPVSSLPPDSLFEEVFVEELELPMSPPRSTNQFPPMVGASPPVSHMEQSIPMPSSPQVGQPVPMPPHQSQQMMEPVQMPQQQPQQMVEPVQMPQHQPQQMVEPVQMPQQQPQQMVEPVQMPQQQPQQMVEPVQMPQQQPQQMVEPVQMPQQQPQQMVEPVQMPQQQPQQMVEPLQMPQQQPQPMEQQAIPQEFQSPVEQNLELTPPLTVEALSTEEVASEWVENQAPNIPQPPILEHAVPPTFPSAMEQPFEMVPEPPPSFQGEEPSGGLFIEDSGNQTIPTSIFLDPILPPDAVNPSSISLEPSAPMELGAIDPVEMQMDFQSMTSSPTDTQFEFSQGGATGFTEFDTVMNDDSIDPMNPMLGRKLGEPVEYYNLTEQLVREMAPKFLQTFGTCTCEQCLLDVIAHTLCHLKPKYVVRYQAAFPEIQGEYKKEFASTIVSQLGKSCIAINEKPRHLKPFMGNS